MLAAILTAVHVLGVLSAIDAVMTTRTSQGAVAWSVTLIVMPYLALPAYWILGRSKFQGYVKAREAGQSKIRHVAEEAAESAAKFFLKRDQTEPAARVAERLAEMPIMTGNRVELLIDGRATFDSIFAGIASAREYVLVQFFIVKDDNLGRELKEHLIERVRAGVRVYFLYDEVGSHKLPSSYTRELSKAGVEVHDFHGKKGPWNRFQINFRNHRKIVVVDGREAWVGGHNVGDEYIDGGPNFDHWRDTHLKIEGPAALAVQLSFLEDWHWACDDVPAVSWSTQAVEGSDVPVLITPSGPADRLETASLMFVQAIDAARERVWIASPYFVPDEPVMAALHLAGLRGVDVRVLIPDRPDHVMVYLAAYAYFQEAKTTGVSFYRYREGFLHQKVILVDDRVAAVGTANFDNRSFRLNFEITATVADREFAAQVERMLEADFGRSRKMMPGESDSKPWYFKVAVRVAYLAAPLL